MKKLIVICDHCGKKLDEIKDYEDTQFNTIDEWFTADLCAECYTEISRITKEFCKKECNNEG
jgi:hypothetical protein